MRYIMIMVLLSLSGCVTPTIKTGFAAQIEACREACESRAIISFGECVCKQKGVKK